MRPEPKTIDGIQTGTILIENTFVGPREFLLESDLHSSGWRSVRGVDSYELGRSIGRVGWTFFYMANEVRAGAFGGSQERAQHRALQHVLAGVTLENCNCFEISSVRSKKFLGLQHVRVAGHARHVQKSMFFVQ